MQRRLSAALILAALATVTLPSIAEGTLPPSPAGFAPATSASAAAISKGYGSLPLQFEQNVGQTDKHVKFLTRSAGSTLFLTGNSAVLCLTKPIIDPKLTHLHGIKAMIEQRLHPVPQKLSESVLRMNAVGANASPAVVGLAELPGKVNYLIGNDPRKWHSNVATYRQVRYRDLYKNIDLAYYGSNGRVEYDFIVKPGGDPSKIALAFTGAKTMRIASTGDLVLSTGNGDVTWQKPIVYQERNGHRMPIAGNYVALGGKVRFNVAQYDAALPLVIDPVLVYSTYLGGSGNERASGLPGTAISIDAKGCAYVAGGTSSTDFPLTTGAYQKTVTGQTAIFVTKLDATGTALIYSTYIGGSGFNDGSAIAVDASGQAYVTGSTSAADYPVTDNAFQVTLGAIQNVSNVVVTKLDASGSDLIYSTYLGGSGRDAGNGISIDSSGDAFVTGVTTSRNFPTTHGSFNSTGSNVSSSAFVTKLDPSGTNLVYSTYLGSYNITFAYAITVDIEGNAFVTGSTNSIGFPVTSGAFWTTVGLPYGFTTFVTKLNPSGSSLVYSTFLSGPANTTSNLEAGDGGFAIAVDAFDNAYVTGDATSSGFPISPGAFQATFSPNGNDNAFVTKLSVNGSSLVYSTYLGYNTFGTGIAVDSAGNTYVTGCDASAGYPITQGALVVPVTDGYGFAFLTKLNNTGDGLLYSTRIGGSLNQLSGGLALDASNNAYATGITRSTDFPVTPGAYQSTLSGQFDAYIMKLDASAAPDKPYIRALTPQRGVVGTVVALAGDNFTGVTSVKLNGLPMSFTVNSDFSINATVPTGATTGKITVTRMGVTASSQHPFEVDETILDSIAPVQLFAGGPAQTLTLTGEGFESGSVVQFGSNPLSTHYLSPTQISATLSSSLRSVPGNYAITVKDADGFVSNSHPYTLRTRLISFTLSSNKATSYQTLTATVTLNGPAPAYGVDLLPVSSTGSFVQPGYYYNIREGQTSITFPVNTQYVTSPSQATISVTGPGATLTQTVTVLPPAVPIADSYVMDGASANQNFGSASVLLAKTAPKAGLNRDAYFKFPLQGFTNIQSATLKIWGTLNAPGSVTTGVYATSSSWTESAITWNNRPALVSLVDAFTMLDTYSESSYFVDVTPYVQSQLTNGTISFVLHDQGASDLAERLDSREAILKPQLLITGK